MSVRDRVLEQGGHRLAGRYTMGSPRARGPATDVHPGWDHRLERPVTVELYRPDARPAQRYRREREIAALAALDHPAVLAVHDRGRDAAGRAFVVTQALDGITLAERIERGPQALARVLALGAALAGALAHLHAAGMVHRRLTPSTITLDRRAGPVLHDLDGIATLDVESVTLEEAFVLDDAAYLAPEQVAGHEVGPTADVYSLARVLAACLAAPATHAGAAPSVPAAPVPAPVRDLLTAMGDPDPERRPGASRVTGELGDLADAARRGTLEPGGARGTTLPAPVPASRERSVAPRHRLRTPRPARRPRRRAAVLAALVLGVGIEIAALGVGVAVGAGAPAPDPPAVLR